MDTCHEERGEGPKEKIGEKVILQYDVERFTARKAMTTSTAICVVQLRWQHPMPGIFKLNTDGSRKSESGLIGAGGIIRDCVGAGDRILEYVDHVR
ncbi:hypothetical protein Pyn_14726 [Prunus yedoensis var. nudiflora]|uniref:RNase H type-1 domain-containing protein n=1 Tax=Prunus yedoensis var. nudiflora TaxID=2094558 RepID=A0A314UKE2_PRUYE|nr:hypothetical protein Pyn_14726 [Prunus yedoensis var. nudiflora]